MSIPTATHSRGLAAPRQSPVQAWSGRTFRALLATLSRPGHIEQTPTPEFLHTTVAPACRLALALASRGTAIALPGLSSSAAREIADLTGASITGPAHAELVAFARPPRHGELLELARGTASAPEQGASAAIGVTTISPLATALSHATSPTSPVLRLSISGPGVDERCTVEVDPGGTDLEAILRCRNSVCRRPPAGIDLWLFDRDGRILGLPRSSTITWPEEH